MGCTANNEPIEANNGYLCSVCFYNLRNALQKAPRSLQHLREVYVLKASADLDTGKQIHKDPPAPFNLDAFQIAEDIFQALDERYIPVSWTHKDVYDNALQLCADYDSNLAEVANKKEVIYLMPIVKLVRTALYRYPIEEKPRATLLPCPNCNQRTVYSPPSEVGENIEVRCHNCAFTIPPEKMEFYANMAERERDANL